MKNLKTLGIAGGFVAAALVGGTLISVAFAAPGGPSTSTTTVNEADASKYCDQWKTAFAKELGVSVDSLLPAAKAASIATIDAALAAGDITADRATALKEKVNAADGNGCRFFGHPFLGDGPGPRLKAGIDLVTTAADALGMQPAALMESLRSGDSLKDVATAQGKDYAAVSKAIHDAAKADLDKAVAAGLDQARADEMLSKLDEALASGDFPAHMPGRGHFGFPGMGHDDAPAPDAPAS